MVSTSQTMFQRGSSCRRQEQRVHRYNYNANDFKRQTAAFLRSLHMFAIKKTTCCYARRQIPSHSLHRAVSGGGGGGEKWQEIINSSSSWLTPPSHPEVKGQEEAEGEDEPVGVWCSGSTSVLFVSITNQHFISAVVTFITGPHIKVTKC